MRKLLSIATLGLVVIALIVGLAAFPAGAADHLDAPFVKTDGRIDINDVYVFHPEDEDEDDEHPGTQNLGRTVLVMTVNPAAGVISGEEFRPDALYELLIDKNGDARPDITVRTEFSPPENGGEQNLTVRWIEGDRSRVIARGETEDDIKGRGGVGVFAGLRDDPFFFDLANFNLGAKFCGAPGGLPVTNFFLGLNVSALVVEVPTKWIGAGPVGVWGRTVLPGMGQVERMGRPAILTVFIPPNPFESGSSSPGNLEDQFNFTKPEGDQATWRAEVVNTLLALGNSPARANALADVLLPDILTVDLSGATGFLNGRNLADDVIDAELQLLLNNPAASDCIANDSTFLDEFPYLGTPN